jgi:hypothetical protein
MTESSFDGMGFHHAARLRLPRAAAPGVLQRWNALSSWPDWDVSLSAVIAARNVLELGGSFHIVPKVGAEPIRVDVVSFSDMHFTTASFGPLGLLCFGHSLSRDDDGEHVWLEHTIFADPHDASSFAGRIWPRMSSDVDAAAAALARLVVTERGR